MMYTASDQGKAINSLSPDALSNSVQTAINQDFIELVNIFRVKERLEGMSKNIRI